MDLEPMTETTSPINHDGIGDVVKLEDKKIKGSRKSMLIKRLIGIGIVLMITLVNATSSELSQYILVNDYNKPFLIIYYNMIWLILALPIEIIVIYVDKRINSKKEEGQRENGASEVAVVGLVDTIRQEFKDNGVSVGRMLWVSLLMSILYTGLNYAWILGLPLTEVSTSNALFQSATIFVFFLSIIILKEKPTILKSLAVVFFISGVVGILLADRASSNGASYEFPDAVKGDILMVGAAGCYGVWQVLTAKFLADKKRTMVHTYIGLMGAWCLLFGIPILAILNFSGYEVFEMPPTSRVGGLVTVSAFLTFTINYLINWALSLTSPLFVRSGELLIIPVTLLFDIIVKKVSFPAIIIPGFLFIVAGFCLMMFVENRQLKRKQKKLVNPSDNMVINSSTSSLPNDEDDEQQISNPLLKRTLNFMRRNLV